MSDDIFAFGPIEFSKQGNAHDGRRYGFVRDEARANRFGYWSEAGSYQTASLVVAENMNLTHGADVVQQTCAFTVLVDDVVACGYDKKGPNGGRWINAKSLTPINGRPARKLTDKYRSVIDLLATAQV